MERPREYSPSGPPKTDETSGWVTEYEYDVDESWAANDPHATFHNRLLRYHVYDDDPATGNLLRTVTYTYYKTGRASNITDFKDHWVQGVTPGQESDYDWFQDMALYYYTTGTLKRVLYGQWKNDQYGDPDEDTYESLKAWEFRYDSPRARYLAVELNVDGEQYPTFTLVEPIHWTDSIGDAPYGDIEIWTDGQGAWDDPNEVMRYLGLTAQQEADGTDTQYFHGDLIDSTMLTTDADGDADLPSGRSLVYTAFGEIVDSSGVPGDDAPARFPRYQYAGGWGYESGLLKHTGVNADLPPITLQHVGWRWYQPDIGRFVQRDPIGLDGGMNVYAYCQADPLAMIDPNGTMALDPGFIAKLLKAGGAKLGGRAGAIGRRRRNSHRRRGRIGWGRGYRLHNWYRSKVGR